MKALLLENIHPEGIRLLTERGIEVETVKGALDEAELAARLPGVQLLGIRSKTNVTARVLEAAPDLLAVGAFCIGTNQVDLAVAAERGVAVFNAPFSNTRSVVELVVAEIISLARHLTDKNAAMHAGVWDKSAKGAHEVRGRTLGIVGYGNIGSQLSVVAEALGMKVYFYDVADKLALGNAQRCDSLDELLAVAETVSLHVDGRPGNAGLFGAEQFAQDAPAQPVPQPVPRHRRRPGGAARAPASPATSPARRSTSSRPSPRRPATRSSRACRACPNVILTPHVGGSTEEAQSDIGRFVALKLGDYATGGATTMSVNLPQVVAAAEPGRSRILHVHKNVPGVLARVNTVLGDAGVNIEGQTLSTRGELGYVITDTVGPGPPRAGRAAARAARDRTAPRPVLRLTRAAGSRAGRPAQPSRLTSGSQRSSTISRMRSVGHPRQRHDQVVPEQVERHGSPARAARRGPGSRRAAPPARAEQLPADAPVAEQACAQVGGGQPDVGGDVGQVEPDGGDEAGRAPR